MSVKAGLRKEYIAGASSARRREALRAPEELLTQSSPKSPIKVQPKAMMLTRELIFAVFSGPSACITAGNVSHSTDPKFNYELYFDDMPKPGATVINSEVERIERKFIWLIDMSPISGDWYFELLASREWIN